MSDEHTPSYFADQGAEYTLQDYEELLGGDFGLDLHFDDTYVYGTGEDLTNVESNGVEAQDSPPQLSLDGENLPAAQISEEEQTWREHEGLSDFQYGTEDKIRQLPPPDFNSIEWQSIEAISANGNGPEIVGSVHQGQSSKENVDNTSRHTPTRVNSRQPTTISQHGMSSAYSTTGMPAGPPRAPAPTASNGMGTNIYNPRLGSMQGASDDRSPVVRTLEDSAAVESVGVDKSDDGREGNEEGNEDVPNDVHFETFGENDRTIVENPHRAGHGRTGMRNGHQVWFDPDTSKWRK